jgi:Ca2+-binding RTX toxin-like protein
LREVKYLILMPSIIYLGNDKAQTNLSGGDGNDKLTGGNGADKFDCGAGNDKITDFKPSEDDTKSTSCE